MLNVGMCGSWKRIYRLIRCYCAAYSHCRCHCSFFIWIFHKIIICLNIRSSRFRTFGNTFFCRTSSDRFITVYHFGYGRIGLPQRHDNWFSVFLLFAFHGCNRFMFRKTLTHTRTNRTKRILIDLNGTEQCLYHCWTRADVMEQMWLQRRQLMRLQYARTNKESLSESERRRVLLDKGDMMTTLSVCKVEWMCEICPCWRFWTMEPSSVHADIRRRALQPIEDMIGALQSKY